ncbi:dioxygenase family protein [Arsenicicoccus sp. oral taxon 190]|uniref:dioxygenase family protein n=1 Tax=Arsenicicoccus sp. oral taxon 190 TaxID=1658671 RepID=UPI00067A413E|nr:class III extradiol ring-cleavage dioxygenase [Arsenicicoccus sp. oral taxon 190]AKT51152.1 extradiol ring-cleavage dioxygenase [Arsenicicoccus sp. oral taxon 190]
MSLPAPATAPLPVLFLSHGAPPLADDATWTTELAAWSAGLPRPRSILMVSAHWEDAPVTISSTSGAPLVRDFWGFPQRYYEVAYDAPAAPELARSVAGLLDGHVRQDQARGLDHGAYVPLVELYPDADVPVLQLSMPTLDPPGLFALGQRLAPLREEGVLIVGSGFTTHNLRWFRPSEAADAPAPSPSVEFDRWAAEVVGAGDVDAVLDWERRAPAAGEAHPRSEHWAPLFVAMGAASVTGSPAGVSSVDGFWYGLSKRSWTF